ncbi:MAG TPA: tetratricopeptide repeat protein [Verrucomicrobiae bacterium]|jgi:tetratricopeptide (TPR) repeat protein|nr:tetratricopeptide repeat protein [Verrucomicrobiae bacterium]
MPAPSLILTFLLVACFSIATSLEPRWQTLSKRTSSDSDSLFKLVLGDASRMFANHFFVKADVYFHSGYYPSIFQQGYQHSENTEHLKDDHDEAHETREEHEREEKSMSFLGTPTDWIDRFGRHFYSTKHTHLDKPGEAREILPWLKLSAELNPNRIDTYTVAAYWLRERLGKPDEAEEFLREGLRANPTSYEILFELGKLYNENKHDPTVAINLWEMALRRWTEQDDAGLETDEHVYEQILANLANVEETQGNLRAALEYLDMELVVSPLPASIQAHIDDLQKKLAAPGPAK